MTPREAENLIKAQADFIEYQRILIEELTRLVRDRESPFVGLSRGMKV